MSDPFFFGYGSLVNRATHGFPQPARARVRGWARAWRGTRLRKVAYLTAVEAPGAEIEGLVAAVPGGNWADLDHRERAYDRHAVIEIDHDHGPDLSLDVHIYKVSPHHESGGGDHPILLSYINTVVQGYLREFGEAGARRFFETTDGWDTPILDDRTAPIYPRAQAVTGIERDFVNDMLAMQKALIRRG